MFISNCDKTYVRQARGAFVRELMRHIDVASYGACWQNKVCHFRLIAFTLFWSMNCRKYLANWQTNRGGIKNGTSLRNIILSYHLRTRLRPITSQKNFIIRLSLALCPVRITGCNHRCSFFMFVSQSTLALQMLTTFCHLQTQLSNSQISGEVSSAYGVVCSHALCVARQKNWRCIWNFCWIIHANMKQCWNGNEKERFRLVFFFFFRISSCGNSKTL